MATHDEYKARIRRLRWSGLQKLWDDIAQGHTPTWEPGRAFEYLVLRMFELDGAQVRWPYSVSLLGEDAEEIDGAIHCAGLSCIVESKDTAEAVNIAPIAKLRNQLLRRPADTVGLMFSRAGFTDSAHLLAHFTLPQAILLWEGKEVEYALSQKRIGDYLVQKYRVCVEEGVPDYDICKGENP